MHCVVKKTVSRFVAKSSLDGKNNKPDVGSMEIFLEMVNRYSLLFSFSQKVAAAVQVVITVSESRIFEPFF